MASFNRIILVGNLTRDPELSYTPSNTAVCKFGMATNRKWKDRDGNEREDVCFVDCTSFAGQGEVINKYLSKGRQILVEGRLSYQRWTSQDGQRRSKHEVIVESFQFMDSGQRGGGGGGGQRGGHEQGDGGSGGGGGGGGGRRQSSDEAPSYDDSSVPAGEDIPF